MVGDFAAAQQPVIVVLNEGTSLTVQAVVSSDRRFVRLTVVPFFTQRRRRGYVQIHRHDDDDQQFVGFEDREPTTSSASKGDTAIDEGTTVQLPTVLVSCRWPRRLACPTAARCCWAALSD